MTPSPDITDRPAAGADELAQSAGADRFRMLGTAWRTVLRPLIPVVAALPLWVLTLDHIDIRDMTDRGLVSVLPFSVYVALGILTVSFCFTLRSTGTHWLRPPVHVLALVTRSHG